MCMKKFNAEKVFFEKFTGFLSAHCRGYTVSLACSQLLVITWLLQHFVLDIVVHISAGLKTDFLYIKIYTIWRANMEIGSDPNNSVIKRFWGTVCAKCTLPRAN